MKTIGIIARAQGAKNPVQSTAGAACFDLAALNGGTVPAKGSAVFGTGLKFRVPDDHVMLVYSRSGMGFKSDIRLANCVGVIDSDYEGEVKVKLTNDSDKPYEVAAGDRIAQAMLQEVFNTEFIDLPNYVSDSERGEEGFGSTGA